MDYFVTTEKGDSLDVMSFKTTEELVNFSSNHPDFIFEEVYEFEELDEFEELGDFGELNEFDTTYYEEN